MTAQPGLRISQRAVDAAVDSGVVGDRLLRWAIRRLLRQRDETLDSAIDAETFVERLSDAPITVEVDAANSQHYEVPPEFFVTMLGPALKYSCAWWEGVDDLAAAERAMLDLTCERAALEDGQDILELGCGWGSLTLHMAALYPNARIVAVSNSHQQRTFILASAAERGLTNVTVLTADVAQLGVETHTEVVGPSQFDRVVSVEMFEHVRNHCVLTDRIATWLRNDGQLFVHVFVHRSRPYLFEVGSAGDWMARHFFTGGMMPSEDLLPMAVGSLRLDEHWRINGTHYARTLAAWLDRLDEHRDMIISRFADDLPRRRAKAQWRRWRVFTIACEELFAADAGDRWFVAHYRFAK
ncbi:MAG: cyclopropane-fatty-acyl-phospholipid synthase family protein [Nitriliruptoraceae bacterium]